ncbi:MAG TPA: MtnX-like HAD-IB family phosphatase [Clostridia bacterium]|nr:MtnX-like HAD-IB family phosphatase [Clostridia bacterium]
MEKKLMFFIDFDGTVTCRDVCEAMIMQYARPGWEELNRRWEEGTLSTVDCARETLAMVTMSRAELAALAASQQLDPGFPAFAAWARKQGYPVYILSDGYEDYIELILQKHGLEIPFYANKLRLGPDGWDIEAPYYNEKCGRCGACKSKLILDLMDEHSTRVYIGDGYSDRCPVYLADMVFAKRSLADYCRRRSIPYRPFEDFRDIIKYLQGEEKHD